MLLIADVKPSSKASTKIQQQWHITYLSAHGNGFSQNNEIKEDRFCELLLLLESKKSE